MVNRQDLNEYKWNEFFEEFQKESPRAAVIISGAFLDSLLRDLIATFMIDDVSVVDDLLGTDNNADRPLASFGARIKTAYCLGLISKAQYDDLKLIQKIRNKFAHKMHGYSFEEPEIVKWCESLQTPNRFITIMPSITKSHGDRYVFTVSLLSNQLGLKILETQGKRRIVAANMKLG